MHSDDPQDWLRSFGADIQKKLSGKRANSWVRLANKLVMMGVESSTDCSCIKELEDLSIPESRQEVEKFHKNHLQYNTEVYKIISVPLVMTNLIRTIKKDLEWARNLAKEVGREEYGGQGRITSAQYAKDLLTHFLKSDPSPEWVEKTS